VPCGKVGPNSSAEMLSVTGPGVGGRLRIVRAAANEKRASDSAATIATSQRSLWFNAIVPTESGASMRTQRRCRATDRARESTCHGYSCRPAMPRRFLWTSVDAALRRASGTVTASTQPLRRIANLAVPIMALVVRGDVAAETGARGSRATRCNLVCVGPLKAQKGESERRRKQDC
jgi:hypothetical protein